MLPSLPELDDATRVLVQLSAAIAASDEATVRYWLTQAARDVPPAHVEELLLQSYLFCGFPRALNAAREWRRVSQRVAPDTDEAEDVGLAEEWRERGELTCAAVYGDMYEKLRLNVRDLHPALDTWMVVDGYGKVLGRPGLDLQRRELCVVAACAAMGQDRQLHSHLRGALNVGVEAGALGDTLDAIAGMIGAERARSAQLLLARVRGK
ncbi:MAG TPA: carboxymuconolactone decarboxylase family protein [Gemmatimonadaceae bacterium]|nr:carboxymuconolactone decarboxylase family protein [Gemmatimonadaceae bacterium]